MTATVSSKRPGPWRRSSCGASKLGGTILLNVEAPTQLEVQGEVRFHDPVIEVDVAGTTHQRTVTGYVRLQPWQDHEPCVRILQLGRN
ncbi:hypothetical protein [Amycolatopsis eburnea]|uniref:hypothetical protein n=1 Tax=Amycolatopsis eburnea TaxID=2267691 RepID=UPI001315329D|nr:hypothetical protein [Amycolatopsis eburnea]